MPSSTPIRPAAACQRAENEIAGAPTGGMDQAVSLRAREGHALLLDFRDGSAERVPLDLERHGLALLVVDTRATHALVDGQYESRRRSCEHAAHLLGVPTLREVEPADLDAALDRLEDPETRRRVRSATVRHTTGGSSSAKGTHPRSTSTAWLSATTNGVRA